MGSVRSPSPPLVFSPKQQSTRSDVSDDCKLADRQVYPVTSIPGYTFPEVKAEALCKTAPGWEQPVTFNLHGPCEGLEESFCLDEAALHAAAYEERQVRPGKRARGHVREVSRTRGIDCGRQHTDEYRLDEAGMCELPGYVGYCGLSYEAKVKRQRRS
jgi:hypothetical protein